MAKLSKTLWTVSRIRRDPHPLFLVHVKNARFLWVLKTSDSKLARTEARRLTAESNRKPEPIVLRDLWPNEIGVAQ